MSVANDAYSDTFESPSGSIASTVDTESENATSLPSSCNSFTTELQSTGTITLAGDEDGASTSNVLDTDRGDGDDCSSSVATELFLNQKLEHLRLHTEEDRVGAVRDPARKCAPESEIIDAPCTVTDEVAREYSEAVLRRLRCVHDEKYEGEKCSKTKETSDGTSTSSRLFPVRCERLKMEALKHRVKSQIKSLADEVEDHYHATANCTECMEQQHCIAEREYVCHKMKLLTQTDFEKKLDSHLYQRDSLSLLGDIVGSCVRPSAPSEDVWQALSDKMADLKQRQEGQPTTTSK